MVTKGFKRGVIDFVTSILSNRGTIGIPFLVVLITLLVGFWLGLLFGFTFTVVKACVCP